MDQKKLEQSLSNFKLSDEEAKYNKHLEEPTIKDYDQLTTSLKDALNQFPNQMMINFYTDEKLVEEIGGTPKFYLNDYLKTQNKIIGGDFSKDENVVNIVAQYNTFIDRIKQCASKKSFSDLNDEVRKFAQDAQNRFFTYIRNKEQFEQIFYNMKDQFEAIKQDVINTLPFEEIKKRNQDRQYETFDELLKFNKKILSDNLAKQDSYKLLIRVFDDIVIRLKSLNTEDQLNQIIEEINKFLNI